jgi:hypothetical protein
MGVWSASVFGNDWTADFAIDFTHTEPAKRVDLLRRALEETVHAEVDALEEHAGAAIGSAAIVAAALSDGTPVGDDGPSGVEDLVVPADLVPLALRAFDRVVGEEPEFVEMWSDPAFAPALQAVRRALAAFVG